MKIRSMSVKLHFGNSVNGSSFNKIGKTFLLFECFLPTLLFLRYDMFIVFQPVAVSITNSVKLYIRNLFSIKTQQKNLHYIYFPTTVVLKYCCLFIQPLFVASSSFPQEKQCSDKHNTAIHTSVAHTQHIQSTLYSHTFPSSQNFPAFTWQPSFAHKNAPVPQHKGVFTSTLTSNYQFCIFNVHRAMRNAQQVTCSVLCTCSMQRLTLHNHSVLLSLQLPAVSVQLLFYR